MEPLTVASNSSALRSVPPRRRARITNDPLARHNGHSSRGRRIRDLYRAFAEAIGWPQDAPTQAALIACAELQCFVEERRTMLFAGTTTAELDAEVLVNAMKPRRG